MSVIVSVSVEGSERLYFKIAQTGGNHYVERPDKPSIHAPELSECDSLEEEVVVAVQAIMREDDKWITLNQDTQDITYPMFDLST